MTDAPPGPTTFSTTFPAAQPLDEHNRALLAHVHPADWQNPVPTGRYNLVVIGAGTAGLVTAAGAAGLGAKVALIERDLMGGDCLNVGCVPSKALLRSAAAAAEINHADRLGITTPTTPTSTPTRAQVDFPAVMRRLRRLRAQISTHDSALRFAALGVDVYLGQAHFTSPRTVDVAGRSLTFAKACIATGARPAIPDFPSLADAQYLTNETVFSLTRRPDRLAILGGGPIGCEFAQAFARLGSRVTLIHSHNQLLPHDDPDAAGLIAQALRDDGVELLTSTTVTRISLEGSRKRLELPDHPPITVDHFLVAIGRAPNVDSLNLPAANVEYDSRRGIHVDDRLRTTNRRIYAAGDVCMTHKFTHAADAAARIVIQNALFFGRAKVSRLTIPWCTYTDPQLAHVGLTGQDAARRGIPIDTITVDLADVDRAVLDDQAVGLLKIYLKKNTDRILGATLVAAHAGEIISQLTLALVTGTRLGKIASVIHPYPTQAEAVKKAADAYRRQKLTPLVKRIFHMLLRWQR